MNFWAISDGLLAEVILSLCSQLSFSRVAIFMFYIKYYIIMEGLKQLAQPIEIPSNYSYLCVSCAKLVDINEFVAIHRTHGNYIDRPLLEKLIGDSKDDL